MAIVETGWTKGIADGRGDKLGQYVVWTDSGGTDHRQYNIGPSPLPQSTWLWFKVLYSYSANRWEVWLENNVPWYQPYPLGWTSGATMAIGGENNDWNGYINASHYHPQYRVGAGAWTLYNYAYRNTIGQGCIRQAYDYGAFAWGPTSSCP